MFCEFKSSSEDDSIISFVRPNIDITRIMDRFEEWGASSSLYIRNLIAKLLCRLSVTNLELMPNGHGAAGTVE
ncbi:hypothetical protein AYI68_g1872 [Smittium mucronatum]|uniref:Uncharacterized protein n=1 Tax=Smittium mucronatum TaxID=133383 RepID=A0A1R0H4A1_9FUNG|nr:hypothetical protein AYI68_g1872 [Smittium mucronatum]